MKYDFTSILDRRGRDAIAVDGLKGDGFSPAPPKAGFDAIPMWVADMNFPTVPTIQEAIIERAKHPAFGYFQATDAYFDSIIRWHEKRNGVTGLKPEHIGYENGVLGGVISALNCVCSRGDKILIHSPTYIGFTMSLKNNGYEAVHSPLVKDENGVWRMDFEDMEKHLKEEHIHAAILCNPHNPCGRVWERWELEKAMELFKKYDVYVVSDEIWSDIILNGHKHTPTQSVSEDARMRTAAFYAPSKTFNLAGLAFSCISIPDAQRRERFDAMATRYGQTRPTFFAPVAAKAAWDSGEDWLTACLAYIRGNYDFLTDFLAKTWSGRVSAVPLEGTYLAWVDFRQLEPDPEKLEQIMTRKAKVALDEGYIFGPEGNGFERINLAAPRAVIEQILSRIAAAFQ